MWASMALRKLMLPLTPLSKILITSRFKFEILYRLPSVDFGQTAKRMGWYQGQQATRGETSGVSMEVFCCSAHRKKAEVNRLESATPNWPPATFCVTPATYTLVFNSIWKMSEKYFKKDGFPCQAFTEILCNDPDIMSRQLSIDTIWHTKNFTCLFNCHIVWDAMP